MKKEYRSRKLNKLSLNKETIKALRDAELKAVAGGTCGSLAMNASCCKANTLSVKTK